MIRINPWSGDSESWNSVFHQIAYQVKIAGIAQKWITGIQFHCCGRIDTCCHSSFLSKREGDDIKDASPSTHWKQNDLVVVQLVQNVINHCWHLVQHGDLE